MEFFGINAWEMLVLLLLAMFIFGPERLPKAISDGVRMVRNLRDLARNATNDLNRELGTDIALEDLNPKALLRKHVLSEEDERAIRAPLEELYRDVRRDVNGAREDLQQATRDLDARQKPVSANGPAARTAAARTTPARPINPGHAYDEDAT